MSDPRFTALRAARPGDAPAQDAERAAQHAILADLLGPYADGELPAESAARVEAHLVGCARCRRDLGAQVALRDRLAAEPVAPAPSALRDRILAATAALPAPALPATASHGVPNEMPNAGSHRGRWVRWAALTALVLGATAGGVGLWSARRVSRDDAPALAALAGPAAQVPLVAAALADYRRATAGDLPGRARDLDAVRAAVGLPVEPLRTPGLRLLAAWTTTLAGDPCAVLAYRRGDRLVLHYLVPEAAFFRHSALRAAAVAHRPLAVRDGAQAVLAWPEATSGALLVSDDTPRRLAELLPHVSSASRAAAPATAARP